MGGGGGKSKLCGSKGKSKSYKSFEVTMAFSLFPSHKLKVFRVLVECYGVRA